MHRGLVARRRLVTTAALLRDLYTRRALSLLFGGGRAGLRLPVRVAELQAAIGGNSANVQRQVWTLATDGADLKRRLRGWVTNVGRGIYALSPGARAALAAVEGDD